MTQTNEKAKALKHVREVCPELMEFKKGCEIVAKQNGITYWYKGEDHNGVHWYQSSWAIHCNDLRNNAEDNGFIKGKIIGHTPHLEHWLLSINPSLYNGEQCRKSIIDCYNLTKDGNNQSPEFYQAYNRITS